MCDSFRTSKWDGENAAINFFSMDSLTGPFAVVPVVMMERKGPLWISNLVVEIMSIRVLFWNPWLRCTRQACLSVLGNNKISDFTKPKNRNSPASSPTTTKPRLHSDDIIISLINLHYRDHVNPRPKLAFCQSPIQRAEVICCNAAKRILGIAVTTSPTSTTSSTARNTRQQRLFLRQQLVARQCCMDS